MFVFWWHLMLPTFQPQVNTATLSYFTWLFCFQYLFQSTQYYCETVEPRSRDKTKALLFVWMTSLRRLLSCVTTSSCCSVLDGARGQSWVLSHGNVTSIGETICSVCSDPSSSDYHMPSHAAARSRNLAECAWFCFHMDIYFAQPKCQQCPQNRNDQWESLSLCTF